MATKFIKNPEDLQTKHRAICDGFLEQAIQKTEKAKPFVKEAKNFYQALEKVKTVEELLSLKNVRSYLVSACGFSDKAKSQFTIDELNDAMKKILTRIYREAGGEFREEILYRFLLTKGDSLGGSMRNLTGASASSKFVEKILSRLTRSKQKIKILKSKTGKVQRIAWNDRILLFDVKPRLIGKNIDVILLSSKESNVSEGELLDDKTKYIACGELKGGIDPAGADEHWKTANSALDRIRAALGRNCPALFFVGAAIEASMAKEIFTQLKKGHLSYAANSTYENQINDLADWLIGL